jgi:ribose transport system ATP-binding protein
MGRTPSGPGEEGRERTPKRLELSGASKSYGRKRVLNDVGLEIAPAEIHALAGHNGSGKSTLIKILSCYHEADPGLRIRIDGRSPDHFPMSASALREHGITVVHQNLGLAEDLSVLENLRVGRYRARRVTRTIDWAAEAAAAQEAFRVLGVEIDLQAPVRALASADRAAVAIARCLQDVSPGRGLVIFDEATQALTLGMLNTFYTLIRRFVDSGTSALVVSHRVDEILGFADRVSVLRDGALVASGEPTAGMTAERLTAVLLGEKAMARTRDARAVRSRVRGGAERSGSGLTVSGLGGDTVAGLDLEVEPGEILGLTGLVGGGFIELCHLLAGARSMVQGAIEVDGHRLDRDASLHDFLGAGIAFVPGSRATEGLALELTVRENLTLPRLRQHDSRWRLTRTWQVEETERAIRRFGIRTASGEALCSTLSGGNQQKVLLAKWLYQRPRVLVLLEPTAGVDLEARSDLLDALVEASEQGTTIVFATLDFEDLAEYCDRVMIVADGVTAQTVMAPMAARDIAEAVYATS